MKKQKLEDKTEKEDGELRLCTFFCDYTDEKKSQHKACHIMNGVYCKVAKSIRNKGSLCLYRSDQLEKYKRYKS